MGVGDYCGGGLFLVCDPGANVRGTARGRLGVHTERL
jgi:hypothetical protein